MPGKEANPKDTVKVYYLDEVVVTSSVKETNELKNMPTAVSVVSPKQLRDTQIESLPGLSAYIPNFFYSGIWLKSLHSNLYPGGYRRKVGSADGEHVRG